jgi:SAM-dependent methyltransferase
MYNGVDFFKLSDPYKDEFYVYWGERCWEYEYITQCLNLMDIKGKNVVEVGIGLPGQSKMTDYYVNSGANIIGLDINPDIEFDTTFISENVKIYKHSADDMFMVENESVDCVVAISSMEHMSFSVFNRTINEACRVLKHGGYFIGTLGCLINLYQIDDFSDWAVLEHEMFFQHNMVNNPLQNLINQINGRLIANGEICADMPVDLSNIVHSDAHNCVTCYFNFIKK